MDELFAPIVPAGPPPRDPRSRRVPLAIAGAVVAAAATLGGAFALLGAGDDEPEQVVAAASPEDEGVPESVRAFVERWNAPTTTASTLPRPTTTTTARPATTTTAMVRRSVPRTTVPRTTTTVAMSPQDLAAAEDTAHRLVAAMNNRDCEAFWSLLSTETIEFFEAMAEGSDRSVKDELCTAMRDEEMPTITVRSSGRGIDPDRVAVDLEADGDVEPLVLVREADGRWLVDLLYVNRSEYDE